MTKRITAVEQRIFTDEDGNVTEKENVKSYNISQEEDYIKIYIKHINYLHNLPQGLDPLIFQLFKYTSYKNQIIINSSIKRQIAIELDKTFNTVNSYITKLVNYKIILRIDTGVYILNPVFYGRGKWKDILELREKLEVNIVYEDGRYTITHKNR